MLNHLQMHITADNVVVLKPVKMHQWVDIF